MKERGLSFLVVGIVLAVVSSFLLAPSCAGPAPTSTLPKVIGWVAYPIGSEGHTASMALAEGVKKTTGVEVRIIPGGNDVARIMPLIRGEAVVSLCGAGGSFGYAYGIDYFAREEWGPQPVRNVWAGTSAPTFFTTMNTGIKTVSDIKGKRVARMPASVAHELQFRAEFKAAGMTWNDVKPVVVGSTGDAFKAVLEGTADVSMSNPFASQAIEIDSKHGIVWIESAKTPEALKEVYRIAPFFTPGWMPTGLPGLPPGSKVWGHKTPYNLVAYADANPDLTYLIAKGAWQGFDSYKRATEQMKYWTPEEAVVYERMCIPYHDGSIRFFKEQGVWTSQMDAWQKEAVIKENKRIQAFKEQMAEAAKQKIDLASERWYGIIDGKWHAYLLGHADDLMTLPTIKYEPPK